MPLDGIFLHSLATELKNTILNSKVVKINQPEKDEVVLNLKNGKNSYKLVISASANYPRIHLTQITKPNPSKAPLFCMILRKYLNSSTLIDINQITCDRIIILDFNCTDELGFNSTYSLVVEIMGRRSNITLVRKRDVIIMDCIKHITSNINTYRILYPGVKYNFPPKSAKLNPIDFNYEDLTKYINSNTIQYSDNYFSSIFTGVSKQLSKEMSYNFNKLGPSDNIDLDLFNYCSNFFKNIKNLNFNYRCYYKTSGAVYDFHCVALTYNDDNCSYKTYSSSSELLDNFYSEKDKYDRIKSRSVNLQKLINTNLERCYKKINILEKTLDKCKSKGTYELHGELLTANIYKLKKGMNEITVYNYRSENNEQITISLDFNKTPSENVQYYFKKYNKLKTSEKMAKIQEKITQEEIDYLESVLTNLENCEDYESIQEIKTELVGTGYIKYRKSSKKNKQHKSVPMHFKSSDGCDIYVGKNNIQNDYLTLKFANKHDIWMHTKKIHGSHVIIKSNGDISQKCLEEAAALAAYYSKARNSSKVPVDYTEVKNVKKPSGAKPGMVIYYTNQTIYIDPKTMKEE